MKKTDAQLIISAVGRAVRKLLNPMKEQVVTLSEKLTQAETIISEQRATIDQLRSDVADMASKHAEGMEAAQQMFLELKNAAPPSIPTVEEIVAKIQIVAPPSAEEVASLVLRELPTPEQVKQFVADAVPKPEDVAKLVTLPSVPTAEEIAKHVVVPTADDVAKLVPVPVLPTIDEIVKRVQLPELPELPHVPTLDEILASVKELLPSLIPAPVKGDKGDSITIDDVRPIVDELIKSLPKPQDGKSLTIDDVRPLFAEWALDFERRGVERHDKLLAQLPKPKDGRDGLGIESFDAQLDMGSKTLHLTFARDGVEPKSFAFFIPWLDHKGVWREEAKYLEGDCVTRGGSTWMATKSDPVGEPMDGKSENWRLIVKRGNDGRDLTPKDTTPTRIKIPPRKE